ncbi:ABC transporter ATP-binding protein [Streptomyces sp. UNOC14_S4]|uniref:ABC transporter ATP-binding protein n=1 Tax=Streptomyces sp. UNOC14_S4 TaxID=2872340 RepID=UPI001E5217D7|nr:ABC transporter ATP-binding protein [Streptomyces sp. UNOC14_S4]MCC3770098.1 ABC transporter ATP-binding protein/permease [Streptomyces sp. UNOC14_S4]
MREPGPGRTSPATRLMVRVAGYAPWEHAGFAAAAVLGTLTALWIPAALADALRLSGTRATVLLGVLLAGDAAATVLAGFAKNHAVARCTARLRKELAGRLLAAGPGGARRFPAGDLAGRLVAAAEATADACFTTVTLLVGAATSAGALIALLVMDWRLAAVFVLAVPLTVREMRRTGAASGDAHARYQREQATITGRLSAALAGIRSIRATGTQAAEAARILAPLPALDTAGRAVWHVEGAASRRTGFIAAAVMVAVIGVVALDVAHGRLAPPDLLAAAGYATLALRVTDQVSTAGYLGYVRASAARVREVLDLPPRPPAPHAAPAGDLVFDKVTAVGEHGDVLLDGLDLAVPSGCTLAVVGAAGPALEAVAALAGGLAAPDSGRVTVGGHEVTAGAVGYAFARPVLFGTTVRDALVAGRPTATDTEVEHAAQTAGAGGFVHRLPQGYATPLDGLALSGGERQRLGLARTVVHDRPTVVLDDATSSLDTATEAEVTRALDASMRGRTRLVVAHRAATAARADLVAWLDDGRIRALGTHDRLCRLPAYRALFTPHGAEAAR